MHIDCCQQVRHVRRKEQKKVTEAKIAVQHRYEQRRMERKVVKDSIKKKYGLSYKNHSQKIPLCSTNRPTMEAFQFYLKNLFHDKEGKEAVILVMVLELV
ncbi:unnamed protein product [Litomosoides sigmodontis]|uniref:Uncharacterized protein n=1 Tax=Litomosoides sigmodontis TaxID=42156 RepID=A0A3P6SVF7_LITSI|nr:unnamed protein product [Litomosoides sigmodontis]